jgi:predicted dehydrogenase
MLLFASDQEILAHPKLADTMIIATQDAYHKDPCLRAMEKGYDILLEKPIAATWPDVVELCDSAKRLGRKVLVCHVLRYTPFYSAVKKIIESGELGEIVSVNAREGVGAWHQAHSYVRGHWAVTSRCSPMIVAKSCHDLDILCWLIGRNCESISSYGSLSYFKAENCPAGAPLRCTDGCPHDRTCMYNARHYSGPQRKWLELVMDNAANATDEDIELWLRESPWGRCVYQCENTAVDHQVVSMLFSGGVTSTFTMTAFDEGRSIEIFGTKARLLGGSAYKTTGGSDIAVIDNATESVRKIDIEYEEGGYSSHGGGDVGLMKALYEEMMQPDPSTMRSSIQVSMMSHAMGFAAEESRVTGRVVNLQEFAQGVR